MKDIKDIKQAFEAMMFVWGSPLDPKSAAEALGVSVSDVKKAAGELVSEYEQRRSGLMVRSVDGKYQFCTHPEMEPYIAQLCTPVKEKRLSNAAMEVLAIISYKQPVSRSEIEYIRGIKCDKVVEGLMKRGLVQERGRGSGLGRPILYGTTEYFLEKFGISSLEELPVIEDIADLDMDDDMEAPKFQQIKLEL